LGALHGVAQYNIGIIYQMLGQHDMALAAFTHAEIKNKSNFRLKYQIGESLYAIQKFESALGNFEDAFMLATNAQERDSISIRKAETLVNMMRFQEAINIFIPLASSIILSDRAGVGLGMAYLGVGNVVRARLTFEEQLKHGSLPNAYYGLAMVYEAQDLPTDASIMIDKALTLQPDNQTFVDYRMGLSRRAK
jgi:tetratricopeptide (TPR) repeat protein